MVQLRPYQDTLKTGVYDSWRAGNRNVLAVLPTGGGKSKIMSSMVVDGAAMGWWQAVLAHRNELVTQMSMHLAEEGLYHRVVGSKETVADATAMHREAFNGRSFVNPDSNLIVASVQTINARAETVKQWADQVLRWYQDEAHHLLRDNIWGKATDLFKRALGVGFTATPARADGKGLGRDFDGVMDDMVLGPVMRYLIDIGALSDYEIAAPESDFEVNDSDFDKNGELSPKKGRAASKRSHIVGDVVKEYTSRAYGKQFICFATDVETAGEMAVKFTEAGIPCAAVSAQTPTAVRNDMIRRFKRGQLRGLVNVDLFGEGFDCLDLETEILTPNGWVDWITASQEKECYAWDSVTHSISVVPIDKWGVRALKPGELMWEVKSQHADIRVSEGHRIFYRKMNHFRPDGMGEKTHCMTARDLHNARKAFAIPLSGECSFNGIDLNEDQIRILGWYLTDGWLQNDGKELCFSQTKPWGIQEITRLLENLGWEYTTRVRQPHPVHNYPGTKPAVIFSIGKRGGWWPIREYFVKDVYPKLHDMTREQFRWLWEALLDGDGSRQAGKSGTLTCTRKVQVDAYMRMAILRGLTPMYGTYRASSGKTVYSMRVRDNNWLRMKPTDKRGATFTLSPATNEAVWCVQNRLGTLITRRKGKVAILGNCPATEAVIMARPTASLGVYLQQFGRALRTADGKDYGLIIDHVSNWKRHGLPDKMHRWSLARREKKAARVKDPEEMSLTRCTSKDCGKLYEAALPACPHCGNAPPLPEPRSRSIEMVAGNLILLDRAKLAEMRAAAELEAPADLQARVEFVAGPVAGKGVFNRQIEKITAQTRLKDALAQWAAIQRFKGRSDEETYRRFYLTTGVDVLSALGLNDRQKYDEMAEMIEGWCVL